MAMSNELQQKFKDVVEQIKDNRYEDDKIYMIISRLKGEVMREMATKEQ